jgi:prepilin-type N-terminal cleavage/methylation domain-containing protein
MSQQSSGFTLVELMITIAVIVIIAAIAVPAYNGYIREGHYANIRATINQMRTPIEDSRLENGGYGATGNINNFSSIKTRFNLDADLEPGEYSYTVAVISTTNYHVWGRYRSTNIWLRCEDRASRCCNTNASNDPANACP